MPAAARSIAAISVLFFDIVASIACLAAALSGPPGSAIHRNRQVLVLQRNAIRNAVKCAMRTMDVAQLLGMRPETVSRWNTGKAFPRSDSQRRLSALEYLVNLLPSFMSRQNPDFGFSQKTLNGATPAGLIQAGRIQDVIEVVDRLRDRVNL